MKKILPLLLLATSLNFNLHSQVFQRLPATVITDGAALLNPWAGGLNAPQWSAADLNGDGTDDLHIFDRNGFVHLTFLNTGGPGETKYEFAPHFAAYFPKCVHFAILRDYNRDGAMDLFCHAGDEGLAGLKVFKGRFENGHLAFERLQFPQYSFDVIPVPAGGGFANLPVNTPDFPALDDMDNDGDLDILAPNPNGSKVSYYQNMALEMGFTDDTLIYQLTDDCWGNFYIEPFADCLTLSPVDDCVFLAGNPDPNAAEKSGGAHGGATLCTYDEDNDGDKEVLYGDLIYPNIIRGLNTQGDPEHAWVTEQDCYFPSYDVSIDIPDFPAPHCVDLNNDGITDMIVSPNKKDGSMDAEVGWFYQNVQSNEFPLFELQQKDLLVGTMLDFGTGAQPAFIDYNADGLMDIVVGNINRWLPDFQNDPFLVLLENVGTADAPAFEVVDENWLNFKQFASVSFAFAPTFGDLDNDGDLDLLVGERYGTIFFAENLAGAGNPVSFGPIQPQWKNIMKNHGQYSAPAIHDMNGDGLADLVIGERIGNINYFQNIGSPGFPDFNPDPTAAPNNSQLGGISTQAPGFVTGYSAPTIFACGEEIVLATGSERGDVLFYQVDTSKLAGGDFDLILENAAGLREGEIVRPAFASLNTDDLLDAAIGNYRGGLGLFTSPFSTNCILPAGEVRPELAVSISPNPTSAVLRVKLGETAAAGSEYRIFNALGQLSGSGRFSGSEISIDVAGLESGIYFLEIQAGEAMTVKRFVRQ